MNWHQIRKLLFSQTSKDTIYTLVGTAIASLIGAFFTILVARSLGVVGFGVLSLILTLTVILTDVFDVALNTSMVRFVSAHLARGQLSFANRYLKLTLSIKVTLALLVLLLTILFSQSLSQLIFNQDRPEFIILTGFGVLGVVVYSFTIYHYHARKRFLASAISLVASMLSKVLLTILLILFNLLSIVTVVFTYLFTEFILAFLNQLFLPRDFLKSHGSLKLLKNFLHFNLPTTLGFIFVSTSTRLEDLLLMKLSGPEALGYYAAAIKMFLPAQFIAGSLSTVFAPRFASFQSSAQTRLYFAKAILASSLIALPFLLLIPLSQPLIILIYGRQFLASAQVLSLLVPAFSLFILEAPFTSIILNYFGQAQAFTLLSLFQFVVTAILSFILIPRFHQNGAALAFTFAIAAYLLASLAYTFFKIAHEKNR